MHKIALILLQDKRLILKLSLIILWHKNTAVLRVCKFYVAIYWTRIFVVQTWEKQVYPVT